MKFLLIVVIVSLPFFSNAQSWERITLGINHNTGVEILEFNETYKMIYQREKLGLDSRPYILLTTGIIGYNLFINDRLLVSPGLCFGVNDYKEKRGMSVGLNTTAYYSFFKELNLPIYVEVNFSKNTNLASPNSKSIGFGVGTKVFDKSTDDNKNWKNTMLLLSTGPILTIQEEKFWGTSINATFSLGSLFYKNAK